MLAYMLAYLNDGGVVDDEYVLYCYCGHLGNEDAAQGICYGWINAYEIKLHDLCIQLVDLHGPGVMQYTEALLLHKANNLMCIQEHSRANQGTDTTARN
jgi:hypothetical protein